MNFSLLDEEYDNSDTYGPFPSFKAALDFMKLKLPNPGGWAKDPRGKKLPPKKSPSGRRVKHPPKPKVEEKPMQPKTARSVQGAFRVRVPMIPTDIDMMVRSIRPPQTPYSVPAASVEGIVRFKIGQAGNRVAAIINFDIIQDSQGELITNVTARGLTGVQVSYLLEPILVPLLPQIVAQAVAQGFLP